MAGSQVVFWCAVLIALATSFGTAHARPNGASDDVIGPHHPPANQEVSGSGPDADGWESGGWQPNLADGAPEISTGGGDGPGIPAGDGSTTAPADQPNIDTGDADAVQQLSIDVADIAAGGARSARRVSNPLISEEEAEREERRKRTRFTQTVHGSNVVSQESADFRNGTFMADLYSKENPWLQKYAPFYYPQNPLPTQLNHQPDGPPPVRLRQVHIGDTVLVPPKVQYSDQVLRTIHDAKLRSLPKLQEHVHIGGQEGDEEGVVEDGGAYLEQSPSEEEYGPESEAEEPQQYVSYVEDEGQDAEYEWRPKEAPGINDPNPSGNAAQPEYNTVTQTESPHDSALFSRPGPPYDRPTPPPGFPIQQQNHVQQTQGPKPGTSGSPAPHSVQFSPAPQASAGHGGTGGQSTPHASPRPTVTQNYQPAQRQPTPEAGSPGTGYVSQQRPHPRPQERPQPRPQQRPQPRPQQRPQPRPVQARPASRPPSTPVRRPTASSEVRPLRPRPTTPRPRQETSHQPPVEIVEDNGYTNRVKPDDVIPFSLSYGYEVVKPTSPPSPPPLSQYGKPKASTILGALPAGLDEESSEESEADVDAAVFSTRPLESAEAPATPASDGGFGAPKPGHIIGDGVAPPQVGQAPTPVPPQPPREGYSRPREEGPTSLSSSPATYPGTDPSENAETEADRPEYAAPKDDDVLDDDVRVNEERNQFFHPVTSEVGDQGVSDGGSSPAGAPAVEEAQLDGYMRPKQDDILSEDQAAGFVRSRYFPQQPGAPPAGPNRRTEGGFSSPQESSILEDDTDQTFGFRTTPIQFQPASDDSASGEQNAYSRPKDADIVGFNPNSLVEDDPAPAAPSQSENQKPGPSQSVRGFSPPRPGDLLEQNENFIDTGNGPFVADETPQPTRSILDYGPQGYSKPKDADVLNAGESPGDDQTANTFPSHFEASPDPAPQEDEAAEYVTPTQLPSPEQDVQPTPFGTYSRPKASDVVGGDDSGTSSLEGFGGAPPAPVNQLSDPKEEAEYNEASEDVSGFGPVHSDSLLRPSADEDGFGAPRPQNVQPETSTRRSSSDLYTVDDFLRSEEVSILGAFPAPKPSTGGTPTTTQRTRAAPRPGWRRRADPGPFRAQSALLDAQFANLFVDELGPPLRRTTPRTRPTSARRRPAQPEFGPPFAVLESRADHGWPEEDDLTDTLSEDELQSPPLKFGSAFAAEPLTPPGLLARRRSPAAPQRIQTRRQSTVATPIRRRPPVAPRGGHRGQPTPFGDEFSAPFAAAAASRLSVTAVRPGPNPIPDWPKIDQQW
ncbi:cell surface glycoprotein 1-like [Amphibalanus amphitrite]|uniref:cell surface glycoprotein 1-like n=1 Tax=Amphibalanus amphitrite TaxID=1232801 RepID=UPI001C90F864|nr:cell surface glycoprotein 1-like [Amphibalanus amphitrite]